MHLQPALLLLPAHARQLGSNLAMVREKQRVTFFNASGPLYSCAENDRDGIHLAAAMLVDLRLAKPTVLADALGLHRSTIFKSVTRLRQQGTEGVRRKKRGPRGPHKLHGAVRARAQRLLDDGVSNRQVARKLGISEGAIRHALRNGWLALSPLGGLTGREDPELASPAARAKQDQACAAEGGVAVKRHAERAYARVGLLDEAKPQFVAAEAVPHAGVLLTVPFLVEQGLVQSGREVYGALRKGFFGLTSMLLTFGLMALLRIKTIDQLSTTDPGELGLLLGLDRAPEQRTASRKLQQMAERGLADSFAWALTQRWAAQQPDALGWLYVDGHVRAYHGRKHKLPKTRVASRNMCMPATTDYWVNDTAVAPLFVVTVPANEGLLQTLETDILPKVRQLAGQRRVTLVFDREGWSVRRFQRWSQREGFDVLTYRKGKYEPWPEREFADVEGRVAGRPVHYRLAERSVELSKGFMVHEVRRLRENGHQTSIITTRKDLTCWQVASRMFSRWRQENFFRYMRQQFHLDHMPTNAAQPIVLADPTKLVANSAHKAARKKLTKAREDLAKAYGQKELKRTRPRTVRLSDAKLDERITELTQSCHQLEAELGRLPGRVPHGELIQHKGIVQLERERKVLFDAIKMTAYRAETQMANLVEPLLDHHEDDPRVFLRDVFNTKADIVPNPKRKQLLVRLYGLANRRSTRVMRALCELVNAKQACYPNSELRLSFELLEDTESAK